MSSLRNDGHFVQAFVCSVSTETEPRPGVKQDHNDYITGALVQRVFIHYYFNPEKHISRLGIQEIHFTRWNWNVILT